jgi:Rod binding domain-containing protein
MSSIPSTLPTLHVAAGHANNPKPAPKTHLEKSAQEFEAVLLSSWLEKMNQSFVGETGSQDAGQDTLNGLRTQAIAQALAARGGVGIAAQLVHRFQPVISAGHESAVGHLPPQQVTVPGQ